MYKSMWIIPQILNIKQNLIYFKEESISEEHRVLLYFESNSKGT